MNETKPKRRWFRFGLRTLFVLVTIVGVCAGWVAYQLNWIRQRHEFLGRPPNGIYANNNSELPWSLKLFGEKAMMGVYTPDATKQEAEKLFPEATICVIGH
jgi:hypothetical protein